MKTYHDPRLLRSHTRHEHLRRVAMYYLVDESLFTRQLRKQQDAIERIQEDNRHLYGVGCSAMSVLQDDKSNGELHA